METVDKIFTNYTLCGLCKGACCKSLPGIYHPADIERLLEQKISTNLLLKVFLTEKIAIDWYESDPRYDIMDNKQAYNGGDGFQEVYYLRPRGINALHKLKDPSFRNNPCMHLNEQTGCELPEANRPFGCRSLVPNPLNFPYGCSYSKDIDGSKQAMAIAWIPYQQMIEEAIEIYNNINNITDNE